MAAKLQAIHSISSKDISSDNFVIEVCSLGVWMMESQQAII